MLLSRSDGVLRSIASKPFGVGTFTSPAASCDTCTLYTADSASIIDCGSRESTSTSTSAILSELHFWHALIPRLPGARCRYRILLRRRRRDLVLQHILDVLPQISQAALQQKRNEPDALVLIKHCDDLIMMLTEFWKSGHRLLLDAG